VAFGLQGERPQTEEGMTVGISFGSPTSGSGFNVSSTVSSIMANMQNVETPWKNQISSLNSQDTVISSLGTLLSSLSSDLTNLTEATGVLSEKEGSSSDTSVLTLTSATSSSVAGTHSVTVSSLATTSSGYLTEVSDSSDTLSGSIVIQVGTASAQTVTLDSSDNTLSELASAINSADIGVTASVLSDASGERLSIVSGTSGADGDLTITSGITDSTKSTALSYTTGVTGTNASLTVDGVSLTTTSNTVSDLIPGVTFQLLSTSSTAVQVVVTNYISGAESSIASLITDYNSLISAMSTQEGYDASGTAEPLFGSPTLSMLQQNILTGLSETNPGGYLDSVSSATGVGATISGSIVIQVGTATAQTISVTSSDNTLSGLADSINSADIGVTASVVTSDSKSTLELTSQTGGSAGKLTVTSALKAATNTALSYTGSSYTSTTSSSGTVGTVASASDKLSGSIVIEAGTGTTQTITITSSCNTLSKLASTINSDSLGVTASVVSNSDGTSSLKLVSGTVGSTGALSVTSSLYDATNKTTTSLSYNATSDLSSIDLLGLNVNSDGSISLDASTLISALNNDFTGVQGFFQDANSWGLNFSNIVTNAGTSSSKGILKLALTSNSSIESTLNADISREESLISTESKSLTAEMTSANEIMQAIPSELSQVNELYAAITGYNSSSS
jgi:flagellar hook-associated protein 2